MSPTQPAGAMAFRGRDAEQQVIRTLLRNAQQALGGVLLIDGERGTGKSLLLREAEREAAAQGFALAHGSADRLSRPMPFAALLAALHQPPGLPVGEERYPDEVGSAQGRIAEIQDRLERRAAGAPVLVSLDDMQWANPFTLLAVRVLTRQLARHPLAWILARSCTLREEGAELLFSLLEREGARRITLASLSDDAVAGLLTDAFGAPPDKRLLGRASDTAGNPSLLTGLIRCLREAKSVQVTGGYARLISAQLPGPMDHVARQGLEGLSSGTIQLLKTAAVMGRSFRLEDVADMLGATPAGLLPAIEEAVDAGIIVAAEDEFSFRLELVRHAVASMIPSPASKALHRQFGQILLGRGLPAAAAAGHLLEGAHSGDPASLTGLDTAAAEALDRSPEAAARLALRALELTRRSDPRAPSRSVAAAEALVAVGRIDQAEALVRDTLARPLPAALEARLRCALSSILCARGQALQAASEAQGILARPQLSHGLRDHALITQLEALAGLRDNQAASRIAAHILATPADHSDQAMAAALITRGTISWDEGRLSEGLELLREAARCGDCAAANAGQFQPLLALAAALVDVRRLDEAESIITSADTETLHGIPSAAVPEVLRARIHLAQGHLREAAFHGDAALAKASAGAVHGYSVLARCVRATIALRQGDLQAATALIASRPVGAGNGANAYARAETTLAEAQVTELREGPAAAMNRIREVCADLPMRRGFLVGDPANPAWLVRTALAAGDDVLAAWVARVAEALARENPEIPSLAAAAAHSLGLLDLDPSNLEQAAQQHHDPWGRASAAEDLGLLLARKDRDRAVGYLAQAVDGYGLSGAAADLARVRRRLRRLGVRRRHWAGPSDKPATGWESLTETERVTSELIAHGLSNQQAADQMYVSVHTIAFHLRQIFRKLHISSRVELARIVMEQREHISA